MRRNPFSPPPVPLFLKLWFAFIFCLIIAIWGTIGYAVVCLIYDPAIIGRAVGAIVSGYTEAVK